MNNIYDFDVDIFKIADDFYEAYKRCRKGVRKNDGEFGMAVVNVPAVVNAAFACELYIKSMLVKTEYEHNLRVLFEKLEINIREEIRTKITLELSQNKIEKGFEECLKDIDNIFSFWRYIYEKKKSEGYLGTKINEYLCILPIIVSALRDASERNKIQDTDKKKGGN